MPDSPAGHVISVVIPTFNRAALLREAIASVRAQTHRPIQLIIVDDGSTDDTPAVVAGLTTGLTDNFQMLCIRQPNAGVSAARNRGLSHCQGDLVQFLDSDDLMHPQKLATQAAVFAGDPLIDVVVGQVGYFGPGEEIRLVAPTLWDERRGELHLYLFDHDFTPLGVLYKRAAVEKRRGFNEGISLGEDIDLHLRLGLSGAKMRFIPQVLAYQRSHLQSRLSSQARLTTGEFERGYYLRIFDFAEREGCANRNVRAAIARRLRRVAYSHYRNAARATAEVCLRLADQIDPFSPSLKSRAYLTRAGSALALPCESALHLWRRVWSRCRRIARGRSTSAGRVPRAELNGSELSP